MTRFLLLFLFCFTLQAQAKRPQINVWDFGAKGDGVTDDVAAIKSAIVYAHTSNRELFFPSGTYKFSSPIIITNENFTMSGEGIKQTKLVYTGGTATNAVEFRAEYYPFYVMGNRPDLYTGTLPFVSDGNDNRLRYGYGGPVYVRDLSISGNSSCSNAVAVLGQRWATFQRVDARNANNACWFIVGTVINSFIDCMASGSDTAFTTTPKYGFHFSTAKIVDEVIGYSGGTKSVSATFLNSADTFINPMAEVCGKYGIYMENGTLQMTFIGGTSELNAEKGVVIGGGDADQYARYNRLLNMDIEANGVRVGELFTGTDLYMGEKAEQNVADGGIYGGGIVIDGRFNSLKSVNAASITLNGTYNKLLGCIYNINKVGDLVVDNGAMNEFSVCQDFNTGYNTNKITSQVFEKWITYGTNNPAQIKFDNHISGGTIDLPTDLGSMEWYASTITNIPVARVTGYLTNFSAGSHTELAFRILGHDRTAYTNALTVRESGLGVTGDAIVSGEVNALSYGDKVSIGYASGNHSPQINMVSGDSGSGTSTILIGTTNRQFSMSASGYPYEWSLNWVSGSGGNAAFPNILKADYTGVTTFGVGAAFSLTNNPFAFNATNSYAPSGMGIKGFIKCTVNGANFWMPVYSP